MELVAQGIANIASALFGGISVTGTIEHAATNIRAGAKSPISGIMHSIFLLAFMLAASRLAAFVPLCALAGVLVVVCWNMAEKKEFAALLRDWRTATVLLTTFGLTLAEDLTFGIVAGCVLAGVLSHRRPRGPEGRHVIHRVHRTFQSDANGGIAKQRAKRSLRAMHVCSPDEQTQPPKRAGFRALPNQILTLPC